MLSGDRVAAHLGNLEKSGNLRVVREKRKSQGKCSCIWSITMSIDLDTKCAKGNYLLGTVVHHVKSERRKGFSYMQVVT